MLFFISIFRYRDAGKEVIDVLCEFGACVERASIDEAYLDLTEVVNKSLEDIPGIVAVIYVNSYKLL